MRKILKFVLCVSLVLHSPLSTLHSQITHASQGRLDENAYNVLAKAEKKLRNVSFTVNMTILDGQKKQVAAQEAQVAYRNGSYRVTFGDQELVCDGKAVWQWNKSANEIVVNNLPPDSEIDLLNPSRLVANHGKTFKSKYIRTDDDGSVVIDMQPRSAQSYHKIRLFVDEESGELRRMEVHKYDSGREIYVFSKQKYGKVSGSFKFDPAAHPGAELIDMR